MHKFLEKENLLRLSISNFDFKNDYRINFLKKNSMFSVSKVGQYSLMKYKF